MTVEEAERRLIMMTLEHTRDNKTRAAEILGISLKTLHNKLNKLRLDVREEGAAESTRSRRRPASDALRHQRQAGPRRHVDCRRGGRRAERAAPGEAGRVSLDESKSRADLRRQGHLPQGLRGQCRGPATPCRPSRTIGAAVDSRGQPLRAKRTSPSVLIPSTPPAWPSSTRIPARKGGSCLSARRRGRGGWTVRPPTS